MPAEGWEQLLDGWPWFRGAGSFPVLPCSEFMPPAYLVRKPYGTWDDLIPAHDDPWGWPISEYEEALTLRPGLEWIARHLIGQLQRLARGEPDHEISDHALAGNPYWPARLAERAGSLTQERFVTLLPLALSRTKDDKGRTRWTLFGSSEQGPAKAFWRSFFTAPGQELPADQALAMLRRLLAAAYGEPEGLLGDLRRAGFRILPQGDRCPAGPLAISGTRAKRRRRSSTCSPSGRLPACRLPCSGPIWRASCTCCPVRQACYSGAAGVI
jgi:hypothetical protein